jgi:zinc protease
MKMRFPTGQVGFTKSLILAVALSSVGASWQLAPQESWRKTPPRAEAPRPFKPPAAREIKFDNGLSAILVEDHRTPMVTMAAGIRLNLGRRNTIQSLISRITVAEAAAELLTEGAGARPSKQFAQEVESLGGRIASSLSDDYVEVSSAVVSENASRMVDLLGDALLRPRFDENELALYRNNRVDSLTVQRQEPAFLVAERFNRVVYGPLQYAITTPTPAAVKALTRSTVLQFYRSSFLPTASVVVVAGDFDATTIEKKLHDVFDKWPAANRTSAASAPLRLMHPATRRIYLISRPGSDQADFRIGGLAVRRSDPDFFPLAVTNAILGAGSGSRLFMNVREQKGYAYDASSTIHSLKDAGTFFAGAETRTEVAVAAIKETISELDRLRNEKVTAEDLQSAKNFLNGQFSLSLSTQGGVAERLMSYKILGLGPDYLQNFRARVEGVSADQVQRVARKYARSDVTTIVVVGDASKLEKELKSLGSVEVLDARGRRLR